MSDSPKADDARDDFILQERLSGRSARSISKELRCTTADVDASLDRTLPKITNEAKRRIIALDLDRLDGLIEVFYKRAIEKVDAQAGLLVVKVLERKSAMLGLDSPQKLDIVQLQAQKEPSQHELIRDRIMTIARGPNWRDLPPDDIDKKFGIDYRVGNGSKDDPPAIDSGDGSRPPGDRPT